MNDKKILHLLTAWIAAVMLVATLPVAVLAESAMTNGGYQESNSYVLYYGQNIERYICEYVSPYRTNLTYSQVNDTYTEVTGTISLYNTFNENECYGVYCVDQYTRLAKDYYYKRINLEDATFFSEEDAALLRSITLKGFPHTSVSELGQAANVEGLTQGEALHATQLAIWQIAYGDDLTINDPVEGIYNRWQKAACRYYDSYKTELDTYATAENMETISAHVKAVYDYLVDLAPTAPQQMAVSDASFIQWSDTPVLTDNQDGTVDVTVEATVNVVEENGSALTLSAVLGDYSTTEELNNGQQTVSLVIEDVPAATAQNEVKLAIDGVQTVSDVFLFVTEGDRETAQELIGYSNIPLPVHAEVVVQPERVLNFYKTDKIVVGTDAEGDPIYEYVPLEGIVFDLYFVADWAAYLNGEIELPEMEDIDLGQLGDPTYHYPDYTVVTDENGKASVSLSKNGLQDGAYVVAERSHVAIVEPVAPFYVLLPYTNDAGDDWEYELTVRPKNDVKGEIEIEKDVLEIGNDKASVDAAEEHTWIISASVPLDIADGKSYILSDTLDNRLDYKGNLQVWLEYTREPVEGEEAILPMELVKDTDYILTVTDWDSLSEGKPADAFTVELTRVGMQKIGAAVGSQSDDYKLRVYFDAQINANASMGVEIPNQATLDYTNSVNYDFKAESDIPVVYTCGISLFKHDAKEATKPLEGAVFQVAKKVENAEGVETLVTAEGETIYVEYVAFYTTQDLSSEPVRTVTTGKDGLATIYGLEEGDAYYLVEIKAPAGYNLLAHPVPIKLDTYSHIAKELDADGKLVFVQEEDQDGNPVFVEGSSIKVANRAGVELPVTGGIGTTIFVVVGALLCLVSGGLLLFKKMNGN